MKKNINIITFVEEEGDYLIQVFYIFPKFHYKEGSLLYTKVNNFLNKIRIGNNLLKLIFKEEIRKNYKNGIMFFNFYKKRGKVVFDVDEKYYRIYYEKKNDFSCVSCKYYNEKNKMCLLLNTKIFNETKNICDFWEEK